MYTHLVLWKLKDAADGMNKQDLASVVKQKLDSLPAQISEIVQYDVGINIGNYGTQFFDLGLISTFANEDDFKRYCVNPKHDDVVAYIQSVTVDEQIVDF
ncbi:Dabb family protein [Thalassotalea sp. HSM 43]|uniref:Dabb family protein n=1 Tax=Thalassotalea sp. HSM 43 TaxID=2552945 RepID=UPI001080F65C|nr:Dabb family protein [Thalassotalea sp. HSM 43]QBY04218.1 Dabb family protein [Thalassotalea sp. HSM 43]